MEKKFILLFVILSQLFITTLHAQTVYIPSPENLKNREWFQDAKFGLFVHWGVYSVMGDGEWLMQNQRIDKKTYEKLPAFFNPVDFSRRCII